MLKRLFPQLEARALSADDRRWAGALASSVVALAVGVILYAAVLFFVAQVEATLSHGLAFTTALLVVVTSARLLATGRLAGAGRLLAVGLWIITSAALVLSPGQLWPAAAGAALAALALTVPAARRGLLLTALYAAAAVGVLLAHTVVGVPAFVVPPETALTRAGLLLVALLVTGVGLSAISAQASRTARWAEARTHSLEHLLRITGLTGAAGPLDDMLDAVAVELSAAFQCDQVQVLLLEPGGDVAEVRAAAGDSELPLRAGMNRFRLGQDTTAGQVVATNAPVIHRGGRLAGAVRLPATQTELGLPIRHGEDVLGVLKLRAARVDAFPDDEIEALAQFADHLGACIHKAHLLASEAALLEATSPIMRAAQQIAVAAEPAQIIDALRQNATPSADYIALFVPGAEGLTARAVWDRSGAATFVSLPPGLLEEVSAAGGVLFGEAQALGEEIAGQIAAPLGADRLLFTVLRARGRVVGCLLVVHREVGTFDDAEVQALTSLAGPIAVVLDNLRRLSELERALAEAKAHHGVLRAIVAARSPEAIYNRLLGEIARLLKADRALLFLAGPDPLRDPDYVERVAVWQGGQVVVDRSGTRYPNAERPAPWQLPLSREERTFNDLPRDDRLMPELRHEYERRGVNALAVLPLRAGETWLGTVIAEAQQEQAFGAAALDAARGLVDAAAHTLEMRCLLQQMEQAAEREQTVSAIAGRLENAPSLSLLLKSATAQLAEVLGAEGVYAEIRLEQPREAHPAEQNGRGAAHEAEEARTQP